MKHFLLFWLTFHTAHSWLFCSLYGICRSTTKISDTLGEQKENILCNKDFCGIKLQFITVFILMKENCVFGQFHKLVPVSITSHWSSNGAPTHLLELFWGGMKTGLEWVVWSRTILSVTFCLILKVVIFTLGQYLTGHWAIPCRTKKLECTRNI